MKINSVIAAVSTPPGKGGVAIIRVSGDGALDIAERVFIPKSKKPLREITPRMQVFGNVVYKGEEIDDGLITYFKSPNSYTGEDVIEISCHGGALVTSLVLEALFSAGAAPASAGEFTRRALLNGKISLTDAEAVGALLEAKTDSQLKIARESSRTALSREIAKIRKGVTELLSSALARIDYPEEDLGDFTDEELLERLTLLTESAGKLAGSYQTARAINEGIKTVICGKPNVGKSSLYNLILGKESAIVTDIKGTTRDVLQSYATLGKTLLLLSDTAGIRASSNDEIENIGISRSWEEIGEAELILALFDASAPLDSDDEDIITELSALHGTKLAILNKCDKESQLDKKDFEKDFDAILEISAKFDGTKARLQLGKLIDSLFTNEKIELGTDALIANARQHSALLRATEALDGAKETLALGLTQDLVASQLELALSEIAELEGKKVTDEVLADIFSKFCVGK